jgi:hypothetical protein
MGCGSRSPNKHHFFGQLHAAAWAERFQKLHYRPEATTSVFLPAVAAPNSEFYWYTLPPNHIQQQICPRTGSALFLPSPERANRAEEKTCTTTPNGPRPSQSTRPAPAHSSGGTKGNSRRLKPCPRSPAPPIVTGRATWCPLTLELPDPMLPLAPIPPTPSWARATRPRH